MGKTVKKPCEVMGGENMKGDENEKLITGQRQGGNLGKNNEIPRNWGFNGKK